VGDRFSPDMMVEELGSREIAVITFVYERCCNPIYGRLDALEDALAELRPSPDQIERNRRGHYRFASVMRNPDPRTTLVRYSLPHAAAASVVRVTRVMLLY